MANPINNKLIIYTALEITKPKKKSKNKTEILVEKVTSDSLQQVTGIKTNKKAKKEKTTATADTKAIPKEVQYPNGFENLSEYKLTVDINQFPYIRTSDEFKKTEPAMDCFLSLQEDEQKSDFLFKQRITSLNPSAIEYIDAEYFSLTFAASMTCKDFILATSKSLILLEYERQTQDRKFNNVYKNQQYLILKLLQSKVVSDYLTKIGKIEPKELKPLQVFRDFTTFNTLKDDAKQALKVLKISIDEKENINSPRNDKSSTSSSAIDFEGFIDKKKTLKKKAKQVALDLLLMQTTSYKNILKQEFTIPLKGKAEVRAPNWKAHQDLTQKLSLFVKDYLSKANVSGHLDLHAKFMIKLIKQSQKLQDYQSVLTMAFSLISYTINNKYAVKKLGKYYQYLETKLCTSIGNYKVLRELLHKVKGPHTYPCEIANKDLTPFAELGLTSKENCMKIIIAAHAILDSHTSVMAANVTTPVTNIADLIEKQQ